MSWHNEYLKFQNCVSFHIRKIAHFLINIWLCKVQHGTTTERQQNFLILQSVISHKPFTGCYYHTRSLIKGHPLLSGQISHVWRHRIAKKDHPSYYIWLPLLLNCKQGGIRRGGHCTSHNNSNNI